MTRVCEHEVIYNTTVFSKGFPRKVTRCIDWLECGYQTTGKIVFTKDAYAYVWLFSSLRNKLFDGHYELRVCIPCGHITVSHYSGKPSSRAWRKEVNKHAFDKPEYMGDCHYLHFHIPRWLGAMMPKRIRYDGIAYKRYATWETTKWKEGTNE